MIKNLFQLYCMAICFVCAIVILIGGGVILNDLGNIAFTELKQTSRLEGYESNDLFKRWHDQSITRYKEEHKGKISDDEITELRTKEREQTLTSIKNNAKSSIFSWTLWLFMAGLFFFIHLALYRRQKH